MIGKIGSALCIVGSTLIVLHVPEDEEVTSVDEIITKAANIGMTILLHCDLFCSIKIPL